MTARSPTFDDVNTAALAAYPGLLQSWFPNGHLHGHEFCVGNLKGDKGESLSINIQTGVWSDFAEEHAGSDPVSLYAAFSGIKQGEAKTRLAEELGLATNHNGTRHQQRISKQRTNGQASAANGTSPTTPPPAHHHELGEPTFVHEYATPDGSLIFYHLRFDLPDRSKEFRPLSWCDGQWRWKGPEGLLPLYGLPDLAAHPDKPVLLVEGEKTAEVAREILPDFVVVTWPHGGEATGKVDWSPLKGRYLVCWPDADPDGKGTRTMEAASEHMRRVGAKSAAIIRLPEGLPAKWDLGDLLPEGWTEDTILELIEGARLVDEKPATLQIISPPDWQGIIVPERQWIVDKLIPQDNVTMLSGDGGLGKSQLALQLLISSALSRLWLGYPTLSCKSLGVFCEDDKDELHRRAFWICQDLGAELRDLQDLKLISQVGLDSVMVEFDAQGRGEPTHFFNEVLEAALEFGARIVVLDSLHDLFAGNENFRPQARQFINLIRRIAIEVHGGVLLTAHPSLSGRMSGTGEAGSTAWNNAVRSRLYLTSPAQQDGKETDPNRRTLTTMKANYAAKGETIECEWRNGVFVPVGQGLSKSIKDHQAEEAFLECLDLLTARGTKVSEAPTSSNHAPKKMARMKESGKYSKRDLEQAMERLFSAGAIINKEIGKPSRAQHVIVRVESEQS